MQTIVTPSTQVTQRIHTRASAINIMNPWEGDPEIRFTSERRLVINDVAVSSLPCPNVQRMMSQVATDIVDVDDPVTGRPVRVSAAGMALVIAALYCKWFAQDEAAREAAKNAPPVVE